jgi:hypothetical protein
MREHRWNSVKIAITIPRKYIAGTSRTLSNKRKVDLKTVDQWDQPFHRDLICFDPHLVYRFEIHWKGSIHASLRVKKRIKLFLEPTIRPRCYIIVD